MVKPEFNLRITPFLSFFWNFGRVENIRHKVETTTKRQETTAMTWSGKITERSWGSVHYLCCTWVVGIFKQIPQRLLCLREESCSKVLLSLLLYIREGGERRVPTHGTSPGCSGEGGATWPCSKCVGSRAPGGGRWGPSSRAPHRSPGHTPATRGLTRLDRRRHSPPGTGAACWSCTGPGWSRSSWATCRSSIPSSEESRRHTAPSDLQTVQSCLVVVDHQDVIEFLLFLVLPLCVTQWRNLPRRDVGNLSRVSHLTSCLAHFKYFLPLPRCHLLFTAHVEDDGPGDHLVRDDQEGRGRPHLLCLLLLPDGLEISSVECWSVLQADKLGR